jgi:hypothetical protein
MIRDAPETIKLPHLLLMYHIFISHEETSLYMAVEITVATPSNEHMNLNSNLDSCDALKLCKVIGVANSVPKEWI